MTTSHSKVHTMNINRLGAALLACFGVCASAQAMHLSHQGSGQALVFPYYTVNGDNQTLISIVNSSIEGKATRLFFREGRNARIVAELTIYLGPFDVWTGSVFDFNGGANLVTRDNTCTVPALKTSTTLPQLSNGTRYLPFSNAAYTGASDDSGPNDLARAREGYFELIEMGEVRNTDRNSLDAIIINGVDGIPADCGRIVRAWDQGGYWRENPNLDMAPPGGGLYGSAVPINTLFGAQQMLVATAIEAFSGNVLHSAPGLGQPTLASANTGPGIDTLDVRVFVDGAPLTLTYPVPSQAIDAVSALFMAGEINNEFITGDSVGGASEWIVTMPTKRFYTDVGAGSVIAPFTSVFPATGTQGNAPELVGFNAWTRDGLLSDCSSFSTNGCIIGVPPPLPPSTLNAVTNVMAFNQAADGLESSAILGSNWVFPVDLFDPFDSGKNHEGSFSIRFATATGATPEPHQLRPDLHGVRLRGLPVIGAWIASYTNTAVTPGVLANYSDAVPHTVRQERTPAQ